MAGELIILSNDVYCKFPPLVDHDVNKFERHT